MVILSEKNQFLAIFMYSKNL